MKIKICLNCLVAASLALNATAQTPPNNEVKIIPPSPSVAELGRFGLANARLSDGAFATQLPVYEYKTKNLSLPISLAYSTNGLLVDKVAGSVGMDWALVAGGSIGRMVLNLPDERKAWVNYPSDFPNTTGQTAYNFVMAMAQNDYESVPDIYSFNFNGNSGRFLYYGPNGGQRIVKLEQNNLGIQKTSGGFIITDNSGIKYYFTETENSLSSSDCAGNPYKQGGPVTTAWMLSRIEHPLGDVITLLYKPTHYVYSSGITQTYTSGVKSVDVSCSQQCPLLQGAQQCISSTTIDGLVLDKIYSNYSGLLRFDYVERSDIPGDLALSGIDVYDATCDRFGNTIPADLTTIPSTHSYELDYTIPTAASGFQHVAGTATTKRMFLTTFIADDKVWKFTYNNLDQLPPRLSFCQDQYGYFNGQVNSSLIPDPTNVADHNNFASYGFGSRRPDAAYSVKGTISRIMYPTGGSDSIIYESHTVYHPGTTYDCGTTNITRNEFAGGNSTLKKITNYYSQPFVVHCSQRVSISVGLSANGAYPPGEYSVLAGLAPYSEGDPIPGQAFWKFNDINGTPMQTFVGTGTSYQFNLAPGTYVLAIAVGGPSNGTVSFSYNDASIVSGNTSIGGVRVKEVITNTFNNAPLERKYYYSDPGTNNSSGLATDEYPNYLSPLTQTIQCTCNTCGCLSAVCSYNQYSSNNFYSLYTYGGNHIYYSTVTEDLGNNFAKGSIEHHFQVVHDANATPLTGTVIGGSPLSSFGIYNGFEYQTKYFKNTGTALKLYRQIDRDRVDDARLSADNNYYFFSTDPGFNADCINILFSSSVFQFRGLHASMVNLLTRWLYNSAVTTTEYDDNDVALLTTVSSTYDNPVHQQVTQTQLTNSKGETKIVQSYYPTDNITLTDPDALAAKASLESNHMYGALLKQQTYNGSSLLKDEQYDYTNNLLAVPVLSKHYEAFAGDALQLKMEMTQYGFGGTVLETKGKGTDWVSYLWDYKQLLPIAQAVNTRFADIAFTSFEADGSGNWTLSDTTKNYAQGLTGRFSYDLNAGKTITASVTGATSKSYIVSYWALSGSSSLQVSANGNSIAAVPPGLTKNGWIYYQHILPATTTSVAVTCGSNATIDELRLYPFDAQITTYTYSPLVGLTGSCAPNNMTAYYEYDAFARLARIRDMDKNIVKQFDYKYNVNARFANLARSVSFTRNDCAPGGTPGTLAYAVPAGKFFSPISQADADQQAQNDIDTHGQQYVNAHTLCTFYNVAASGTFTKNDCGGAAGSTITYPVAAGVYSSIISQADADQQAQNDIQANGQTYANDHGICPFYNTAQSGTFTRNNCTCGQTAMSYTYTVAANVYSSLISQADADAKAINDVNTNGQTVANNNASCLSLCSGVNKKVVNCVCETGTKLYIESVRISIHQYNCSYYYSWSDGSQSAVFTETSPTPCPIQN